MCGKILSLDNYIKRNNPNTERKTLYGLIYMRNLKEKKGGEEENKDGDEGMGVVRNRKT